MKSAAASDKGAAVFRIVYVLGTFNNSSALTISGTLYCLHYGSMMSAGSYDYGYFNNSGRASITKMNVTSDWLNVQIPQTNVAHVHSWDTAYTVDVQPTCTSEGSKSRHCTGCSEKTSVTEIAMLPHQWSVTNYQAPDVCDNGHRISQCTVCGEMKEENFPRLKAFINVNATTIVLKKKQSTTGLIISLQKTDKISEILSSNSKIVTGKITGTNTVKITAKNKTGKATLTIVDLFGLQRKITVKVQSGAVKPSKLSLNIKNITLKVGQSYQLKHTVEPFTCVQKATFTSSKKKIATVGKRSGVIKAKSKGTAKITGKVGGKKVTCQVTVQ